MKLDKAIEIKEQAIKDQPLLISFDFMEADRMSIEALKRLKSERPRLFSLRHPLLPGETEE